MIEPDLPQLRIAGTGHRPNKLIGGYVDKSLGRRALREAMRTKVKIELAEQVDVTDGSQELLFITGGARRGRSRPSSCGLF